MNKKCYCFFGGLLDTQAKWLNQMSQKGYRLVRTGTLLYEFEKCKPDEVTYCVEFIGEKSKDNATDYANFLEDMGYKVFFKNINLNYSVGKLRLRPWAEMGGRIATNATTFNRELLIVEKANDGKPFELHTSYADKEKYYRNLRNPWLFLLLLFALFAIIKHSIILGIFFLGFCNSQHSIPVPNYKCPTKSQNMGKINNNQEGDNKSCRPLDCYL